MGSSRLLTSEQLAALGTAPRARLEGAVRAGDLERARAELQALDEAFRSQVDRYLVWVAAIVEFVAERYDGDALVELHRAVRTFLGASTDVADLEPADPDDLVGAVLDLVAEGRPAAAMAAFDEQVARWRCSIDFHRDWISAELSHVYRAHGPDDLEVVLRRSGDRSLVSAFEDEANRPPVERLERFVALLHGHFTELSVEEDDHRFIIRQDPCGTCERQVRDGRYGPPMNLAVVDEPHVVTWGGRATTIYRTHVPVWHVAMATERLGVPWPVNQCPVGTDHGPCTILLYKDSGDPRASAEVPVLRPEPNGGDRGRR